MRDFFIPTSQIKIGSSSLPILIRMGQYDKNIGTSGDLTDKQNAFLNEVAKGNLGCMGNNSFDFGIDCRHYPLVCSGTAGGAHEETAAFQKINHTLQTTIFPSFKRKDLENDFIILEIPDYGN